MMDPTRWMEAIIQTEGPLSLEKYMALALTHPLYGYYSTRSPLGARGDFITAPEISQIFGEMLGLSLLNLWKDLGEPDPVYLIEWGPGRGTLMADVLRVAQKFPPFFNALHLYLIEISFPLRAQQKICLAPYGRPLAWASCLKEIPDAPSLLLANEFFDALPLQQFEQTRQGWRERCVGIQEGHLKWELSPVCAQNMPFLCEEGTYLEWNPTALQVMQDLGKRFQRAPGAALVIDYGYTGWPFGNSFQAVRAHQFVDPLDAPGTADLTAHVHFSALAQVVKAQGCRLWGPCPQGSFLRRLGLIERAQILCRNATSQQQKMLEQAVQRLILGGPLKSVSGQILWGMGDLFKVLGVAHPTFPSVPLGF